MLRPRFRTAIPSLENGCSGRRPPAADISVRESIRPSGVTRTSNRASLSPQGRSPSALVLVGKELATAPNVGGRLIVHHDVDGLRLGVGGTRDGLCYGLDHLALLIHASTLSQNDGDVRHQVLLFAPARGPAQSEQSPNG